MRIFRIRPLAFFFLFIAIFWTVRIYQQQKRNAEVQKTAEQLRKIGEAIMKYSNDSAGPFPRTLYAPGIPATAPTTDPIQP